VTRELRLFNKNIGGRETEKLCMAAESCPVSVSECPVQREEGPINGGEQGGQARVYSKALVEENKKKCRRQDRVPRRWVGFSGWR